MAKRQKIVSAAAEVFREKGYARGSLEDVAAVLGIRKPSLYHYVSSKEQLLQLVFHEALNEGLQRMRLLEQIEDPAERLAGLIRMQVEAVASDQDHFTVFFDQFSRQATQAVKSPRGDIGHQVHELEREYFAGFVSTVRAAVDAGVIPAVDPTYGAQAIIGMTSWIYKWFDPSRHDAEALIDTYTRLIVPRVLPRSRFPKPPEHGRVLVHPAPPTALPAPSERYGKRCCGKAFDVLGSFTHRDRVLSLAEIARRGGLPKVHRVLAMLAEAGAVEQTDDASRSDRHAPRARRPSTTSRSAPCQAAWCSGANQDFPPTRHWLTPIHAQSSRTRKTAGQSPALARGGQSRRQANRCSITHLHHLLRIQVPQVLLRLPRLTWPARKPAVGEVPGTRINLPCIVQLRDRRGGPARPALEI